MNNNMIKKQKSLVVLSAIALMVISNSAFAIFGKATTKTESGNANMKLGEYKGVKHAIGVKDFDNTSGWAGHWKIGYNLSIMLESALFDSGRFVVVEREQLGDIIAEQNLAASGRTAPAKQVARIGKIRPARYLATGSVTEVSEKQSGADGGVRFKGIRVGGGHSEAQVTVIVKLIDTTTGEIIAKERVVGKAGKNSLKVGLSVSGMSTDLGGFKKTPLGQAAQDCIVKATYFIAKKMKELPLTGSVIKATSKGVIINRGSLYGIEVGQRLIMETEGEELMDPDTGEILDKEDGEIIGQLIITKVKEKISYCSVVEGENNPAPSTIVRFVAENKKN